MDAYISEAMSKELVSDIPIYIYEFPVDDSEKKYEGFSPLFWKIRKANDYMEMSYNQWTIASFKPIANFEGIEPVSHRYQPIDVKNSFERTLLERLIKESLNVTGQKNLNLKLVHGDLQEKTPEKVGSILLYPAISLHVNIINNRVNIGFDLTHKFEYSYTLQQMIDQNVEIKEGMRVVHSDLKNNYEYEFLQIAPYSVMDPCPYLKKSIYQYFVDKGSYYVAQNLHKEIKVIHVKNSKGEILSYPASLLKPLCSYETMTPTEAKMVGPIIKPKPDKRMKKILHQMKKLLDLHPYLTFERNPFLIELNDFEMKEIKSPNIYFDKKYTKPLVGLNNGRIYKGGLMTISIFVDEDFNEKLNINKMLLYKFIRVLQHISFQHGVEMQISSSTNKVKGKFNERFFQNFAWEIQELENIFKNTTVLAFITENHLSRLPIKIYHDFKKQFGGKWDITSQVLTEKTVKDFDILLKQHKLENFNQEDLNQLNHVTSLVKNSSIIYAIYNILLGLYVKSGMQPWILAERTNSDCFIGLDVSHEDGKSAAGIMNVIGPNGHLIKQSAINGALAGEKIDSATLKEILIDVLNSYKNQFGEFPKHVTIHRDGRWREDTELIEQILSQQNISFDIVEIIKETNRRMAFYNQKLKKFITKQGTYYLRGNEAYLCATEPRENVGMAKPIKIRQITNKLTMQKIIEDVYKLSFMHIHALNKMRLPATVHYADLSSTAYQRGQIAPRSTNVTHLPFV